MTRRLLYDLASFQNGRAFRPVETAANSGLPVVKIAEMNNGIGPRTGCFDGNLDPRHLIRRGDLLFAWSGTIVIMRWNGPDAALNQHIFKVSSEPDVDQRFIQYLLESLMPAFNLLVLDQKTTMGHVKVADLKRIEVDLPSLQEQRGIAATLGALDDRIESSRNAVRLIPTLIRAKVDSALQQGSNTVAVASLAKFVNGGAYTKGANGLGRMVIRIADLNSGPGASTVYDELDVPDDQTARPGDILMSWSGSLGVYRWFRDEAIVNQHIFKVLPSGYPPWLVFDRLEQVLHLFRGIANDKATTMGHIKRGHLESTSVDLPASASIELLDREVGPLWNRLLVADRECLRLERLRDALLPELLAQRIRVPEAMEAMA